MPPARVARSLIERVLHEDAHSLRLVQGSPILLDVWAAFGEQPSKPVELLLSPAEGKTPPGAAKALAAALRHSEFHRISGPHLVAPLQGFVTARVTIVELASVVAPLLGIPVRRLSPGHAAGIFRALELAHDNASGLRRIDGVDQNDRISALLTLLCYAALFDRPVSTFEDAASELEEVDPMTPDALPALRPPSKPPVFRRVTINRPLQRLSTDSIRTIKADAAQRVFDTSAAELVWAVIDAGIDGSHPAFAARDDAGRPTDQTRIWRAYDFTRLRRLTSFDVLTDSNSDEYGQLEADIEAWRKAAPSYPGDEERRFPKARDLLKILAEDAENERPPSWAMLEPLLRISTKTMPGQEHGTHVAGILAGNWPEKDLVGVCPDLRLLDIRILGDAAETESAVIGALEFIRWLNSQNRWRVVHGVNLSIGMKHDVRNWACGQTPVCVASEDLVSSGVVVVAAAGNDGWQSFLVGDDKRYEGYTSASIMDPGNAESVITVGSTHRSRPHLYGVSFFSSRGPTGDGRAKPDLVAPGEKIEAPFPNESLGVLDGTSMAAPHVSGVAALLMARHEELQGRPADVKAVLMQSAIDLGRERAAQGAGLVDALAALQRR